jgi:hypothetical protein
MTRLIYQGILIGILITMFAEGAHWFITADSAGASTGRRLGVLAQMIISAVLAFVVWRRAKRDALLLEIKLLSERSNTTAG